MTEPTDNPRTDTLLEFPCEFPIKVMGKRTDNFAQIVAAVVVEHAPGFDIASMDMRASKGGNYLSLTCTITATSKLQLDNLYRALSGHPAVSVVL